MSPLAVVTPTYMPDLELFGELHRSVLAHTSDETVHHAVVPREDLPAFAAFTSERCRLWPEDEILPARMLATPRLNRMMQRVTRLPGSARVAAINVRRPFPPIRGWILQQVIKLGLTGLLATDTVLLLDSDVELVRSVQADTFQVAGRTCLYRKAAGVRPDMTEHISWHGAARRLLGLPNLVEGPLPDYVSSLMAWDPAIVRALQRRLELVNHRPWADAVAGQLHLSEWTLYGVFADELMADRLPHTEESRCHDYWDPRPLSARDATAFVDMIAEDDVAVMISAKSRTPLDIRRRAIAQWRAGHSNDSVR